MSPVYFENNEMSKALNTITKYLETDHEDGRADVANESDDVIGLH